MKYDYHIIILGAGSAGLVVASGAAQFGAKVALIEAEKMGGDCLNTGCVPSKALIKVAHIAKTINSASDFGLDAKLESVNLTNIMRRVQKAIKLIEPHDSIRKFEKLGVDVIIGKGHFLNKHTIMVNGKTITAGKIIIATGSKPYIPHINGLSEINYFTNNNIFSLNTLPKHMIILGAGPVGLEIGQSFKYLGSDITIIDKIPHLFPHEDKEVAPILEQKLISDEINLKLNSSIIDVQMDNEEIVVTINRNGKLESIHGNILLVALGRAPVTEGLDLDKAGVTTDFRGYIETNKYLRTKTKNIYACGDITGHYHFTSTAGHEAGVVLKNAIFNLGSRIDYSTLPWVTYINPEIAHVGYTQSSAEALGIYRSSVIVNLADNDRAIINSDVGGFLKLNIGKHDRIIGATLVAENAGEIISLATLAIKNRLKPSAFINMIFPYPTESEVFLYAALENAITKLKTWHKKLIKILFLRY